MSRNIANANQLSDDRDVSRDVTVQLRLTTAERDAIKAAADKSGMTLSEWIRWCCGLKTETTIDPPVKSKRGK